jgi:phenylpropionate dioxygenase-like ring-hydroxylating dioxygenase large terminal subunit
VTVNHETLLEKVPLRVTNPSRIPARRYYDPEFFELERKHLWPHVWQMACRLEEIPEVGDYTEYKILDKSVIVVRTKAGVKAFHNTCRHRGVQLASGPGNCRTSGFICPFHGWRWNMDGENTFVYARNLFDEENLQRDDIKLVPCRVEIWGGCAFINFDNAAPSLRDSLGDVATRMSDRHVEQLRLEWWYQSVLPTNWKLAMEAFMEGFHVMRTHPQLHTPTSATNTMYGGDVYNGAALPYSSTQEMVKETIANLQRLSDGMGGMVHRDEIAIARDIADMELPEDVEAATAKYVTTLMQEITRRGRARGLDVPDLLELGQKHPFHAVEYMFPNYFLLPTFSAMSGYRIRPLTPETCLFELYSLAHLPEDEDRERVRPQTLPYDSPDFPEIPRQDYSNLPRQQLGLHGEGFEFMRLSGKVEGLISNYQRLVDGYIAGIPPEELAKASTIVNNGLDSPIRDIGF